MWRLSGGCIGSAPPMRFRLRLLPVWRIPGGCIDSLPWSLGVVPLCGGFRAVAQGPANGVQAWVALVWRTSCGCIGPAHEAQAWVIIVCVADPQRLHSVPPAHGPRLSLPLCGGVPVAAQCRAHEALPMGPCVVVSSGCIGPRPWAPEPGRPCLADFRWLHLAPAGVALCGRFPMVA